LVMEKLLSGSEEKISESASTFEEAFRIAELQVPSEAKIIARIKDSTPKRIKVQVKAANQEAAKIAGEIIAREKLSSKKVLVTEIVMKEQGDQGFLGIGKQPNLYEMFFTAYPKITIRYRMPVTMLGFYILEGKIVQEVEKKLAILRDSRSPSCYTQIETDKWLFYEAIIQQKVLFTETNSRDMYQIFLINPSFSENKRDGHAWVMSAARLEKFQAALLERVKGDQEKSIVHIINILKLIYPSEADMLIRQVCKTTGHAWVDDRSSIHVCSTQCLRCGEKKTQVEHQWSEPGEKGVCKHCGKKATQFSDSFQNFCPRCNKHVHASIKDSGGWPQATRTYSCPDCGNTIWENTYDNDHTY
jgi:hypothetical protein